MPEAALRIGTGAAIGARYREPAPSNDYAPRMSCSHGISTTAPCRGRSSGVL